MKQDQAPSHNEKQASHKVRLGFQLAKIAKLKRQLIDTFVSHIELSRTEWQSLFWINTLGDCSQKELLKNLEIDAGHLARVLEKLEQKQYITRSVIAENRRCLFIHMTDSCKQQIIPQILSAMQQEEEILLEGFSAKNKELFIQLLASIEHNLESTLNNDITEKHNQ